MPDAAAPDATPTDASSPDWPIPDLVAAAEAHWDDAGRLALLERDLARRVEPEARALLARVAARLRELPRARVIRRDPSALRRPAPPAQPTPEMAAVLRLLALERASGESARREAALLRQRLEASRAPEAEAAAALRAELQSAREEARAAREEAARLALRLATPAPRATARPAPPPDPAYAELGLAPDLPDDLVPVLERALLRHHHPDRAPPEGRDAATRRFQSVARAFETIRRLRGLGA